MPLIVGIAIALIAFAGFSVRQLRRARHELSASEAHARRAADEDKLTGLPNHAKMLELLDLALAERGGDEVTTFVMVELDGMADINAQLGVIGSDALIVAVAERLKHALPAGVVCARVGSDEFALMLTAGAVAIDQEMTGERSEQRAQGAARDETRNRAAEFPPDGHRRKL